MRGIIFIIILLQITYSYSQNKYRSPPGTYKINDSLYIDQMPVTNIMYLEFLESLLSFWSLEKHEELKTSPRFNRKKTKEIVYDYNAKPTSLLTEMSINDTLKINDSLKASLEYLWHPKYSDHPVLQITKEQAEMYCLWRTDMVMYLYATAKNEKRRNKHPRETIYRLPSQEELLNAKNYFKKHEEFTKTTEKSPLNINFKDIKFSRLIFLNISEYTRDSIPYGTNWKNKTPTIFPNDYTGFRCICEVK